MTVVRRLVSIFLVLCFGTCLVGQVAADSLSNNDIKALIQYPNWVGTTGNTSGQCATTLSGNGNQEQIWNYFVGKGLKPVQIAAIMGNMQAESHFEPRLVEYGYPNSRGEKSQPGQPSSLDDTAPPDVNSLGQPGYGLSQWGGGRKAALHAAAVKAGTQDSNLGIQLDYLWSELTGTYKSSVYDPLLAATDIRAATVIYLANFESPLDQSQGIQNLRTSFATDILTKFGSGTAASQSSPTVYGGCAADSSGYQNPFRDIPNIAQEGVDAGVDYAGDGPVHPLGKGTLAYINPNSSWVGGNSVSYTLADGAAKGKTVYVAENCSVNTNLQVGQEVDTNTTLCTAHNSSPYIETGWATTGTDRPTAYDDNCYYLVNPSIGAKTSTAYGVNFNDLMTKLGAPKASLLAPPITCTLPANWPVWK